MGLDFLILNVNDFDAPGAISYNTFPCKIQLTEIARIKLASLEAALNVLATAIRLSELPVHFFSQMTILVDSVANLQEIKRVGLVIRQNRLLSICSYFGRV